MMPTFPPPIDDPSKKRKKSTSGKTLYPGPVKPVNTGAVDNPYQRVPLGGGSTQNVGSGLRYSTGARVATPAQVGAYVDYGDSRRAGVLQQEALDALGPAYQDPFGGANFLDLLLAGGANPGSGGSGGRGGSGGGGGSVTAQAAALQAALDDMYGALDMSAGATQGSFDQRQAALQKLIADQNALYDQQQALLQQTNASQLAGMQNIYNTQVGALDQYGNRIADNRTQFQGQVRDIMGNLASATAGARAATSGAYTAADARLQAIQAEAAAAQAARNQGVGNTLGAFGVDPNRGAVADPAADMLVASRANLGSQAGIADASYANRANVHAGLQTDVNVLDSQRYGSLQDKLAADKAQLAAQFAQQQAATQAAQAQSLLSFQGNRLTAQQKYDQMMADLAAQRQQAAIEAAKERAALALQYAPALAGVK